MLELNTISGAFILPGIIGCLIILGVILRNTVPIFRKMLVPASILGGIIGFILINLKIIPISPSVFEEISFHLLNLSFMSITLASTKKQSIKLLRKKMFPIKADCGWR